MKALISAINVFRTRHLYKMALKINTSAYHNGYLKRLNFPSVTYFHAGHSFVVESKGLSIMTTRDSVYFQGVCLERADKVLIEYRGDEVFRAEGLRGYHIISYQHGSWEKNLKHLPPPSYIARR